jgi:hypothetical protein
MNIPPVIATVACVHCGALSQSNDGRCWLCYEDKSALNPFVATGSPLSEETASSPMGKWDVVFSVLLGLCVLMTVLIGIGLAIEDRGLLVPFAIFMTPAYAITIVRGMVQMTTKRSPRAASLFVTFVVSILATVSISIVLTVAAAIMFFLMCIGELSKMH